MTCLFSACRTGMRRLGYAYCTDPRPSIPFIGQNNGLAIYSRRPFTCPPETYEFVKTKERVCRKGFAHAEIAIGNEKTVHVLVSACLSVRACFLSVKYMHMHVERICMRTLSAYAHAH